MLKSEFICHLSCSHLNSVYITSLSLSLFTSKSSEAGSSGEVQVKFSLEISLKPVCDRHVNLSSVTWNWFYLFVCFLKRWLPLLRHQRGACTCWSTSNSSLVWKPESPAFCLPVGCKPSANLNVKTTLLRRFRARNIDGRWRPQASPTVAQRFGSPLRLLTLLHCVQLGGLDWHWSTKQLPGKHRTCHACLHASSGCPGAISPPCEAVAKLRLGKSFSVAKLVTCEVGKVR